jgi:DNA-binding CsgD family transcriptional regulator
MTKQIVLRDSVAILTPRQLDVLRTASRGLGVAASAAVLGIGRETVKSHRERVLVEMDAPNITAACVMAAKAGLL